MTLWAWIILASALSYLVKLAGYLLPETWVDDPRIITIANYLTVGLLAGLVVTNTVATPHGLSIDARLIALLAAFTALLLRAPFLVVVLIGMVTAALARLAGLA